ncbi:hypothetical protein OGH69_15425 [Flavobacterium sp. MFBS3-15]|uniref:hypothetical protein n=1 Tax=Flavobacterium sp. MFBS3-15 TaxID=2989816 RepID=UPI002235D2E0|nr:hypothetical protein [Flavobacterium sp. MFBS3-15]MCW4470364.1 hypothetical protein [Flavobacterium sp. MFBS3-15]
MPLNTHITSYIQTHKYDNYFNYDLAVDWAIMLLENGLETPNLLMLASFGPPIESREISPYIAAVLKDMGLQLLEGDEALSVILRYYSTEIILNNSLRNNLGRLHKLAMEKDLPPDLMPFYLLYYAWDDLDYGIDFTGYYPGATLENIESLLKKEAFEWLDRN